MTKEQIEIYEYCIRYKKELKLWKEKSPFKVQHHGCGSGVPTIEHQLEEIHRKMYAAINNAIHQAEKDVNAIIEKI